MKILMNINYLDELAVTILFLSGFAIMSYCISLFLKSLKSRDWMLTKGKITNISIDKCYDRNHEGINSPAYKASIQYEYYVNGIKYLSDRIFFGHNIQTSIYKVPQSIVNKYNKKNSVDVYYNPKTPSESVLERDVNMLVIGLFILAICIMIIASYILTDTKKYIT